MDGRRVAAGSLRRWITLALSGALLASGLFVGVASAVVPFETTSDTWIDNLPRTTLTPINVGMVVTAPAADYPLGSAVVDDVTSGTPVRLGEFALNPNAYHTTFAVWVLQAGLEPGTYTFRTTYVPASGDFAASFDEVTFTVDKAPSNTFLTTPVSAETHHTIPLSAQVTWDGSWTSSGTVSFYRDGVATPLCTVAIDAAGAATCNAPALPVGTYVFSATFNGSSRLLTSSQGGQSMPVVADTVHATGVGTQYTTFYPVKDSYRDTVGIKGTRTETASVTIKVYSPGGTLLKTVSIASGTGAYNYNWSGRNSSGTIYAEGKYKVVQTLKDAAAVTKTVTSYVTLSKKKLYTYTKTISKLGSSVSAKGSSGGGAVTLNTTSGYAKLSAPTLYTSWAGAGWELTIPSATIYKWMYVRVYGRQAGAMGDHLIGAQNFSTCPYATGTTWYDSCFGSWGNLNSTTGTTLYYYRTPGLTSAYRSGGKVRIMVSSNYGTTYIYRAEVRLEYQVLKY